MREVQLGHGVGALNPGIQTPDVSPIHSVGTYKARGYRERHRSPPLQGSNVRRLGDCRSHRAAATRTRIPRPGRDSGQRTDRAQSSNARILVALRRLSDDRGSCEGRGRLRAGHHWRTSTKRAPAIHRGGRRGRARRARPSAYGQGTHDWLGAGDGWCRFGRLGLVWNAGAQGAVARARDFDGVRAFRASTTDSERARYGTASGGSRSSRLGGWEGNCFDWPAGDSGEIWFLGGVSVRAERERQEGGERNEDFELHFSRDPKVDVLWSWGNLNANLAVVINVSR
jgi:hypothetical protein